jgi:Uma2 family endonuclease
MAPSNKKNTVIAGLIIHYLVAYTLENPIGYVTSPDGGFELDEGIVRLPDVAFITHDRAQNLEGVTFSVAPDIAVEVVSPHETARDVQAKVKSYLKAGTRLVWLVYPEDQTIAVYRPTDAGWLVEIKTATDNVDGADVLPNFLLEVCRIFPH